MNILVLGRGKTGSLVAEVARQRGHEVRVLGGSENAGARALTRDALATINVVVDFTTPKAALENIAAAAAIGKSIVVGTTGWYDELPQVRELVARSGIGFIYASNFSIGVNLFFEIARTAALVLDHGYFGQIFERHNAQKKDAPSGTAIMLQRILAATSGTEVEIISFREGDVVGMHELELESAHDSIRLAHEAKSRHGFAQGAISAAEWLAGKQGFYDFRQVWRELK
jgi:4-hydroxy-tetrahydrodipicolinate reductase